jgi:TolB protein
MSKLSFVISILILVALLGCAQQPQVQPTIPKPPPAEVVPPPQNNMEIPVIAPTTTLSKIVFVRDYGNYYGWDICTANSDGTDIKRITKSSSMDSRPTWSPDGTQIVFESNREWHSLPSVYAMDVGGTNTKCLTPEVKFCKSPSWSPDGRKIAYCVFQRSGSSKSGTIFMPDAIFIMDSDGKNKQNIGNGWYPSWFSDGQRIAFFLASRSGVICTTNIDGSKTKEYPTRLTSYYLANNYPTLSVSPDSKLVAFDSRDFTGKRDIYILSLTDGTIKKLTGNVPVSCYSPTWLPDGLKIAFTLETSNDLMGHIGTDIYVMDTNGSNPTLLIKNGMFPSWSKGE